MTSNERYVALAPAGTQVIKSDNGKQVEIFEMLVTADAQGTLTVADNNDVPKSYTFHVCAGLNEICDWGIVFNGGKDVTLTAGGANLTIIYRYNLK